MSKFYIWWLYIYIKTTIFKMTITSSCIRRRRLTSSQKRAVNCQNMMNQRKSKYLFLYDISSSPYEPFCVLPKMARKILRIRTPSRGRHWDFRFYGLFGNFQIVFETKKFGFSVLMSFVVFALFRSGFQVFDKTQIGFLDLLLDAVWCFLRFLVGKICCSTTLTAYTSSLVLLTIFDKNLYQSYSFLLFFLYGFAVSNMLQCPPLFLVFRFESTA